MFYNLPDSQEALVYISEADIHAVAGTLKQYFRELPDPLFTANLYHKFTEALGRVYIHTFTHSYWLQKNAFFCNHRSYLMINKLFSARQYC